MCSSPIPGSPSRFRGGICVTVARGPGLGGGGEWGSWCCGVLAPWWRWFDLSLMSSQHLAAPGLPRPNPDSTTAPRIRMSQFPHCTVRFTHGKSHFPGWAAGSVSLPRLARCHRHRGAGPLSNAPLPLQETGAPPHPEISLRFPAAWPWPLLPGKSRRRCYPGRKLTGGD